MAGTKYTTKQALIDAFKLLVYPNKKKEITGANHQISGLDIIASMWSNFTNGLTKTGDDVKLGGTLIENTTVEGDGYNFTLNGVPFIKLQGDLTGSVYHYINMLPTGDILMKGQKSATAYGEMSLGSTSVLKNTSVLGISQLNLSAGSTTMTDSATGHTVNLLPSYIEMSAGAGLAARMTTDKQNLYLDSANDIATFTDVNEKGLEYPADYSNNFTDHSLVTKKYVDTKADVLSNVWLKDLPGHDIAGQGKASYALMAVQAGTSQIINTDTFGEEHVGRWEFYNAQTVYASDMQVILGNYDSGLIPENNLVIVECRKIELSEGSYAYDFIEIYSGTFGV